MSVFGVDFACLNSVVAIARKGGVDIVLNEVSKRETSCIVSLTDEERCLGETGMDRYIRNMNNTVACVKHWIGARAGDVDIEDEKRFLFCATTTDEEGRIKFCLNHQGTQLELYPEQVYAMFLQHLRQLVNAECTTDKRFPADIRDCVITVPSFYSAEQKRLVQQAADIAGLNCMTVIHETTAASIDYGIFRGSSLPDTEEAAPIVGIIDIGYGHTCMTINKFWKGNMRVIYRVNDMYISSREVDCALAEHFAHEIKARYKIDVYENKRARLRLMQSVNKVKQMLSANIVSTLNVENLMDTDVSIANFTREQFEAVIAPIVGRLRDLVARALEGAGITAEQLASCEVIGGGSRIPIFKTAIAEVIGKPLSFTLNATETVAKGAAITAAVYSPKFQVREFIVNEMSILPILGGHANPACDKPATIPFLPGVNDTFTLIGPRDQYPKMLDVSIKRSDEFSFHVFYDHTAADATAICKSHFHLGHWVIGAPPKKGCDGVVKIRVRILPTGLPQVDSAWTNEPTETEVEEERKDPENPDRPPEKVKVTKKGKVRVELTVTPQHVLGHRPETIVACRKAEEEMHRCDVTIIRTKEARNLLESCILDNRSRIDKGGLLADYVTEADRRAFLSNANEFETWLYGDGSESTLEEYERRMKTLSDVCGPATERHRFRDDLPYERNKFAERVRAVQQNVMAKMAAKPAHITEEEFNGALSACEEAIKHVDGLVASLEKAPKYEPAPFDINAINAKLHEVTVACNKVVNKPVPKPPKEDKPKEPNGDKPEGSNGVSPTSPNEQSPVVDDSTVPPPPPPPQHEPEIKMDLD